MNDPLYVVGFGFPFHWEWNSDQTISIERWLLGLAIELNDEKNEKKIHFQLDSIRQRHFERRSFELEDQIRTVSIWADTTIYKKCLAMTDDCGCYQYLRGECWLRLSQFYHRFCFGFVLFNPKHTHIHTNPHIELNVVFVMREFRRKLICS